MPKCSEKYLLFLSRTGIQLSDYQIIYYFSIVVQQWLDLEDKKIRSETEKNAILVHLKLCIPSRVIYTLCQSQFHIY